MPKKRKEKNKCDDYDDDERKKDATVSCLAWLMGMMTVFVVYVDDENDEGSPVFFYLVVVLHQWFLAV